jgi:hypothetical protein
MDCWTPHSSAREREVNDRRDGCVTRQNPAVVGWEDIRKIALSLPEAEEEPGDRPAFRVRGKLFAWKSRDRDGGTLALRVDRDEKQLMLDSHPDCYFQTPHYEGYPGVLVRLDAIDVEELIERIEDAWLIQAPKSLAKEFLASSGER